jgi:hypothetical protein
LLVQLGPDLETTNDGKIVLNVSTAEGPWLNVTHPSAAIPWVTLVWAQVVIPIVHSTFHWHSVADMRLVLLENALGHVSKYQIIKACILLSQTIIYTHSLNSKIHHSFVDIVRVKTSSFQAQFCSLLLQVAMCEGSNWNCLCIWQNARVFT